MRDTIGEITPFAKGVLLSKFTDQNYLKDEQYHDPANFDMRIALHQKFSTSEVLWSDWIFRHLAIQDGQRTLAVGCGNATQWRDNAARFLSRAQLALMDLSPGRVACGRRGIIPADPRFGYLTGDAQALLFPDDRFDRVTANHLLFHAPSMEKAVAECARVIKPGGLFLAATNGQLHMTDLYDLLEEFEPGFRAADNDRRRFGLHNGGAYLAAAFAEVRRDIYPCDLWVTDVDALGGMAFRCGICGKGLHRRRPRTCDISSWTGWERREGSGSGKRLAFSLSVTPPG